MFITNENSWTGAPTTRVSELSELSGCRLSAMPTHGFGGDTCVGNPAEDAQARYDEVEQTLVKTVARLRSAH